MNRIICQWCGEGYIEPKNGSLRCPHCGGPQEDIRHLSPPVYSGWEISDWNGASGTVARWEPYSFSPSVSLSPSVSFSASPSAEAEEEDDSEEHWTDWIKKVFGR